MSQVVHLQKDPSKHKPGTPIHYYTGWHHKYSQYKTTTDHSKVTCKMCRSMMTKVMYV